MSAVFAAIEAATSRSIVALFMAVAALVPASANDRDKILLSPRIGYATIISLVNINSDNAVATFRRGIEDIAEECARVTLSDKDGHVDSRAIARCVAERSSQAQPTMTRRALCSRNTVYTELGNFSLVRAEPETFTGMDGKPSILIRSDWKDHRNEQIIGNCSACGTPVILDTFKVLCPRAYRTWFGDDAVH